MTKIQEMNPRIDQQDDLAESVTSLDVEEESKEVKLSISSFLIQATANLLFITYILLVKLTFDNNAKIFGGLFFNGFRLILLSIFTVCKAKAEKRNTHSIVFKMRVWWMILRIMLTALSSSLFILMITFLKLSMCTTVVMLTAAIQTTLGMAFHNQRITFKIFLGSFIAFFGLYLVMFDSSTEISFFKLKGFLVGILSIYFSSLVNYTSCHLIFQYDSSSLNFISNFWGGIISLIASNFLLYEDWKGQLMSIQVIASILISSIIYFLYYLSLNKQAPDSSNCCFISINHFQYPILLLISAWLLHEEYSHQAYVGFALCFVSSYYSATYLNTV